MVTDKVILPVDSSPPPRRVLIGVIALTAVLLPVSVIGTRWGSGPDAAGFHGRGAVPGITSGSTPVPVEPTASSASQAPVPDPEGVVEAGGLPVVPQDPTVTATSTRPPMAVGSRVGLEPVSAPGFRVRHRNFIGRIDYIGPSNRPLDRADSSFTVRSGLADPRCVSFEAVNLPGYFLRHQNFQIRLHRWRNAALFAADATFCPVAGLSGRDMSFRSVNYPDRYLMHRGQLLSLAPRDRNATTRAAMTFAIRAPLLSPS